MVSSPEETRVLPAGFLIERDIEPVGRWFLNQWDRLNSTRTISAGILSDSSDEEVEEEDNEVFEDDLVYLRSLDPKEIKEQDHYRVLGLTNIRIAATDDQIKRAHRQKVLKHHPDKRKHAGEEIKADDDYFTCITKAFETLGNPVTRRAFDSVDPLFEDDVPDVLKKEKAQDFLKVFTPAFTRNSRWSNKTPVPKLGDDKSTRAEVEEFYGFWYDFDSWREYSYLDEEDKEKASDKWERREIEKINRAQRLEKRKEEVKRIRKLVDNAYNSDPRISKFRKAELDEKAAKKKAKADAVKARKEEEERLIKEAAEKERLAKEEAEKSLKAKQEVEKKEREAHKKLLKQERKKLRTIAKEHEMFAENENLKVVHLLEMEKICEVYTLDKLRDLNERLQDNQTAKEVFLQELRRLNNKLDDERSATSEPTKVTAVAETKPNARAWSNEELQLLIKAVNLFPAGTQQRWEVVAEFVNQHTPTPEIKRSSKEAMSQAKDMASGNFSMSTLKDEVNKMAYENLQKGQKREVIVESPASLRTETVEESCGINNSPWSPDEQKILEQSLKTFPSTTPERWERISESIPGRSKKECMKRYKELAELVKAKKAAQVAAAANKT